jgi:hypothetical protein
MMRDSSFLDDNFPCAPAYHEGITFYDPYAPRSRHPAHRHCKKPHHPDLYSTQVPSTHQENEGVEVVR